MTIQKEQERAAIRNKAAKHNDDFLKAQALEHQQYKHKEVVENLIEAKELKRLAALYDEERKKLEEIQREEKKQQITENKKQQDDLKNIRDIQVQQEMEEDEESRIFAAAKRKMMQLRAKREKEMHEKKQRHMNEIREKLAAQMNEKMDDEDTRIRQAVEEEDNKKAEEDAARQKKVLEEIKAQQEHLLQQMKNEEERKKNWRQLNCRSYVWQHMRFSSAMNLRKKNADMMLLRICQNTIWRRKICSLLWTNTLSSLSSSTRPSSKSTPVR